VTNLDEPQTQQEVRFGCPLILSPEREGKQWSGSSVDGLTTVPQSSGTCGTFLSQKADREVEMQTGIEPWKRRAASTSPRGRGGGVNDREGKVKIEREDCGQEVPARFIFLGTKSSLTGLPNRTRKFWLPATASACAPEVLWLNSISMTGTLYCLLVAAHPPFPRAGSPRSLMCESPETGREIGRRSRLSDVPASASPDSESFLKHQIEPSLLRQGVCIYCSRNTRNNQILPTLLYGTGGNSAPALCTSASRESRGSPLAGHNDLKPFSSKRRRCDSFVVHS